MYMTQDPGNRAGKMGLHGGFAMALWIMTSVLTTSVARAESLINTNDSPDSVVVNVVTGQVYVSTEDSDVIDIFDSKSRTQRCLSTGRTNGVLALNPVTNFLYAVSRSDAKVTVIDTIGETAVATVDVGMEARHIAVNSISNKIYVSNTDDNTVSVIDGNDHSVTHVAAGMFPIAIAVNPVSNKAYVVNIGSNTVTVIDGVNESTQTVPVGVGPTALAVNPVTNKIYVMNEGSDSVIAIDGTNNSTQEILIGARPRSIGVNPVTNMIYLTTNAGTLRIIDGLDNSGSSLTVGDMGLLVVNTITNEIVLGANSSSNSVIVDGSSLAMEGRNTGIIRGLAINSVTNEIFCAMAFDVLVLDGTEHSNRTVAVGGFPAQAAVNPVTNLVYVTNALDDTVTVIDGRFNSVDDTINVGDTPTAVAVNQVTNKIYVANDQGNSVTVIDGSDNSTETVFVGDCPRVVAVNSVTNKTYVANQNDDSVTVIDGRDHSTTTIPVGDYPIAIEINQATNKIYVLNQDSNNVTVIDDRKNIVQTVSSVGVFPSGIAISPASNKVFVAGSISESLTRINGDSNLIEDTFPLNSQTAGVVVSPCTGTVYVALPGQDEVCVVSEDFNQSSFIGVGDSPSELAINPATNHVYVATRFDGGVTIFGGDSCARSVSVGSLPQGFAVNQVTGRVYVVNNNSNSVSVIDSQVESFVPFDVTISPLPGNVSVTRQPEFTFQATSTFMPNAPPISQIYYQVDTVRGEWSLATPLGDMGTGQTEVLEDGDHVIYAFATDGLETSITSPPNTPVIWKVEALAFTVVNCVDGNVNEGASGTPQGVLQVNGGIGGAQRTVTLSTGTPLTISMDASASGPAANARYVLWTWAGGFSNAPSASLSLDGELIGCFAKPTPLNSGFSPQPIFCLRSTGTPPIVCFGATENPSPARAPFSVTRPQGLANPIKLTLQGLLQDSGSLGSTPFSVTNAVVLCIE